MRSIARILSDLRLRLPVFALVLFTALSLNAQTRLNAKDVVPELVAMGLNPVVYKHTDRRQLKLSEPEDRYYLEIRFGNLSRGQYNALMAHFGNASQVPYNATRDYELLDFVHPSIQAVANQIYEPVYLTAGPSVSLMDAPGMSEDADMFAVQKNGISNFTNCWNTTTEILCIVNGQRNHVNPEFYLYWPGRWEASDWFSEPDYSDQVSPLASRLGDVLVIKEKGFADTSMLMHTAYLLTSKLVFEKTDSSENDPYRIALKDDVLAKYARLFEDRLVVDYRRFGGRGKTPIAPPTFPTGSFQKEHKRVLKKHFPQVDLDCVVFGCETRLGGGCDPIASEVKVTKLTINKKTGRGILNSERGVLKRFKPLVPMK